jgi:predicted RNA-binding Zn ribbon-like protein
MLVSRRERAKMSHIQERDRRVDTHSSVEKLRLLGGRLCLDFANTIDPRIGPQPEEFLGSYHELVTWSRYVQVLTEEEAQDLLREAMRSPRAATVTFHRAIALREVIYRVFSAIAKRSLPQTADLEELGDAFVEAMGHARLRPSPQEFQWEWVKQEQRLDGMLWPIARSAVELLTSEEVQRVRVCPGCGWVLLDMSKNGSRQWCSMEGCGSRAKMRRQYARKRVREKGLRS